MKSWFLKISLLFFHAALFFASCEKPIEIDLPAAEPKVVVEGSIEQGQPPVVFLTKSQSYFDPVDLNTLGATIVRDAAVFVSNGEIEIQLDQVCSSEVPEELLPLITEVTGFSPQQLQLIDVCLYTTANESIWGEVNRMYDLRIEVDGEVLTSRTKINTPIGLDSAWFRIPGNPSPDDSLGFVYAILSDPDTVGNAYRWFSKRINRYPAWSSYAGEVKDASFIAPLGSVTDDAFFNGLSFEFGYFRGRLPNSTKEDDLNIESGFFKVGDTIAIRACVIDRGALDYILSFEDQAGSQGSPFASPANIRSNINGGLGAWIGYGASYDTIVCY